MEQRHGSDDPEVFDFLDEFHRDRDAGRERSLAFYLKRYPGHEEPIAREYVRLTEPDPGEAPSETSGDERRIGPYKLLRELGHGGQGMVWLAEDTRIARQVAIKCLPSSFAFLSTERRRRFQREAEVVSRLEHPSICPVYEAQIDHDPPYIAMRLVDGETLAAAISRAKSGKPASGASLPLPPKDSVELRRVLSFFERAARALHAAHEAGVIHRDIKPGNVMVSKEGEPVLLDFGQARDEHAELSERTLSGEVLGTPAYMSPEQVIGSASALDRRTDVWSLGASLFEALTLKRPFEGDSVAALMHSIRTAPLPDARSISATIGDELGVVLETALEKDVARRYPTALALAEDLRRIREYEPILARPASPALKLQRWTQRHPTLAILILSLAVGLAWTLHLLDNERALRKSEHTAWQQADRNLVQANQNLAQANSNLAHALGRHLAERAKELLASDPSASLALALRAVELAPVYQTRAALNASLDACKLARLLDASPTPSLTSEAPTTVLVLDCDLAADSRRVIAGLDGGEVCLWDLREGVELLRGAAHVGPVNQVRFLPGDERFVTSSSDSELRIWSLPAAQLERTIRCRHANIVSIDLDRAGERVVSLASDGTLEVHALADGRRLAEATLGDTALGHVAFSADGRFLLASTARRQRSTPKDAQAALLLDSSDGRCLGELGSGGDASWAEFSHDSRRALTASRDGRVCVWLVPECTLDGDALEHAAAVTCARFTPDDARIVSGTDDRERSKLHVWDLASRRDLELPGHRRGIVWIEISPDGARVAAASSDRVVATWTLEGSALMDSPTSSNPQEVLWTRDGERLVMPGRSSWIHVWWGESSPDLYELRGDGSSVTSVAFSADGCDAATVSASGIVRVWHTPCDEQHRGAHAPGALLAELRLADAHFSKASFLSSESLLVTSCEGAVGLWNWREQRYEKRFDLHEPVLDAQVRDPAFGAEFLVVGKSGRVHLFRSGCAREDALVSFDGSATCARFLGREPLIAVGHSDAGVNFYDFRGEIVGAPRAWKPRTAGAAAGVVALASREDGKEVAAACADNRVRFFALDEREAAHRDVIAFEMQDIAYNHTGTRFLATGPNGTSALRLIDLTSERSDKVVRNEVTHASNLTGSAFDGTGELFLTTSEDGTVLIRKSENGEPVAQLSGHAGPVLCAAFHTDPSGTRVISGSSDGTARLWLVDPEAAARARKPRDLFVWEQEREKRLALPLEFR